MNARAKLPPDQQMTIEEFLAFTESRPDEERWELIEGVAALSPSPVDYHQIVVMNLAAWLRQRKIETGASWIPLIGTGTRVPVSANSLPQPDLMVKEQPATGSPVTDEAIVLFEVLSRSNTRADQAWRRRVYASVPNCQHYVTVSIKEPLAVVYDRATEWAAREVGGLDATLDLAAIGVTIPLGEVYRFTHLGPAS